MATDTGINFTLFRVKRLHITRHSFRTHKSGKAQNLFQFRPTVVIHSFVLYDYHAISAPVL